MKYLHCFVVFCVCLLIQVESKDVSVVSRYDDDNSDTPRISFEDLEKIITAVITIARESIRGVEGTLSVLQESVTKLAEGAINLLGDDIFTKLDELKKEADIFGVDIIECTENREDDIQQLLVTFLNETGFCAVERIDEVLDSFSDIVVDIDNANDLVKSLQERLENCKNENNEDLCVLKVLEEITEAALKVPTKIEDDVNKSKKLLDELENYLFECYHDNYNQMEITAMEVFNGIVECVQDKLDPTIMKA